MARFMSPGWASALADTFNAWPPEERKASKLQDFWDWVAMIRPFVTGRLALAVTDMPGGAPDTLCLDFEGGEIRSATVAGGDDASQGATFVLEGRYEDWQAMLDGYDVGKMIMYRRLMLVKGETLQFFTAAFFWTELLAAIQSVPAESLATAGA